MSDADAEIKEKLRDDLMRAGACGVGFARAEEVDESVRSSFRIWLNEGREGALSYMHNYFELRGDPRRLLEGCATVVSTAWLYNPPVLRDPALPYIARYAYCEDYHRSLRKIMKPICRQWENELPGLKWRICIDSAPVMERYWAVKSGVGFTGRNGLLIVPGIGSRVFLAEILLTLALPPDEPCRHSCFDCGKCLGACPAQAIGNEGKIDCRRCRSALTIESPGELEDISDAPLAGCDVCQDVCPHNALSPVSDIAVLQPLPQILTLDTKEILHLTPEAFKERYGRSALSRMGLEGLRKNLNRQSDRQKDL